MVSLCGELTVGRRLVKKASQELNSEIKVMGFLGRYCHRVPVHKLSRAALRKP